VAVKTIRIVISMLEGYNAKGTTTIDAPATTSPDKLGKMTTESVKSLVGRDNELWADVEVETKS
jgi:hypothetical protein